MRKEYFKQHPHVKDLMGSIRIRTFLFLSVSVFFLISFADTISAQQLNTFWLQTKQRLEKEPIEAKVESVSEPLPYRKFKITLRSLDGVYIRAFLALPVRGEGFTETLPVIISAPGYGGTQQSVMLSECQRGYAVLQVFPRGQGESEELWKLNGADKLTMHLDKPNGAYYQGAYADVIRGIDYIVSRDDINPKRISIVGTSQGGGIALAVAGLDTRIKVVVAHVPFLCNFPLAARTTGSLVKKLLDKAKQNNDTALKTLFYFDPINLVSRLKVPVLLSAGGKDEVCPAATIQSVYEKLPGIKSIMYYPDLIHTSCTAFYNFSWHWLDLYL